VSIIDQFDLSGRTVIVTGAGTGLGREMAIALARAGCDIVGVGRREAPIVELEPEITKLGRRYLPLPGTDVTDSAQVAQMAERAIAEMGSIWALINNVGGGSAGAGKTFIELTDEDWREGMDTNLTSAFFCSRALVPHMLEQGGGRIINVSSVWGFRGGRNNLMYPVAKGGILQLTKALAMTYARENIRCTCIAPGQFPKTDDQALKDLIGSKQPGGRVAALHEIGPLAVFLCSAASDYISGETIAIDGGTLSGGLLPAGVAPGPSN
jgi:NAD(P)-dependent dehydrogenase (short-subunit alcohol dehydrogenase family)